MNDFIYGVGVYNMDIGGHLFAFFSLVQISKDMILDDGKTMWLIRWYFLWDKRENRVFKNFWIIKFEDLGSQEKSNAKVIEKEKRKSFWFISHPYRTQLI